MHEEKNSEEVEVKNKKDIKAKKESPDNEQNKWNKLQLGFWNVAGIGKKNFQFWDYIKEYDFIGLIETWMEEEDWNKVEKTLPKEFKWKAVPAKREHKKGRAKGGIITGIKKHLPEEETNFEAVNAQERIIKIEGKGIRILTMYAREEWENTWKVLKENYKDPEDCAVIIGGDFNARTGEKGANLAGGMERRSKDKKANKVGKEFLEILREKNWSILNGSTEGDEDGNFTFVRPCGSSVIDYAVADNTALKLVKHFAVEKRTESDHMPIKITLELTTEGEWGEKKRNEKISKADANKEYEDLIKASMCCCF